VTDSWTSSNVCSSKKKVPGRVSQTHMVQQAGRILCGASATDNSYEGRVTIDNRDDELRYHGD